MLRSAWFIAHRDVTFMLRQKETLLWVFLMPIVFFYFIGTVTGGFGAPAGSEDQPDAIALEAPPNAGFLLDELIRRLEEQNFAVVRPENEEDLARYSRQLTVASPPAEYSSFTDAVLAGEPSVLQFKRRGEGLGANFDQVRISRAVYSVLADLVVTAQEGAAPTSEAFAGLAAAPRSLTLRVESAGRREDPPTGFSQAVPGTLVMFTMLVLLTSGAVLLVIEREQGMLRRLASTPISAASLVLGKWLGRMALGTVQIAFAMAVGSVLFDMDWGTSLPMVCLVLFGWAAFSASLAIVLGNLARTENQTLGVGVLSSMLLAALGGCWWPIEITPRWMQTLALWLPTGWAMDAMHKLINFGYGPASALPHFLVLVGTSCLLGWVGGRTFRYQ